MSENAEVGEVHANMSRTVHTTYLPETQYALEDIQRQIDSHQNEINRLKTAAIKVRADAHLHRQNRNEHIRIALANGYGTRALARHLGMSPSAISDIRHGRR